MLRLFTGTDESTEGDHILTEMSVTDILTCQCEGSFIMLFSRVQKKNKLILFPVIINNLELTPPESLDFREGPPKFFFPQFGGFGRRNVTT